MLPHFLSSSTFSHFLSNGAYNSPQLLTSTFFFHSKKIPCVWILQSYDLSRHISRLADIYKLSLYLNSTNLPQLWPLIVPQALTCEISWKKNALLTFTASAIFQNRIWTLP